MSRTKRRGWRIILGLVGAVILLAGIAEIALRMIIPGVVAGIVRDELNMPETASVDVSLGGSTVWYALQGGVGDLSITVPNAPLVDDIAVTASAHADFSPFSPSDGAIRGGTAQLTVPANELGSVISLVTSGLADAGRVVDGNLEVSRSLELFGQHATLAATIGMGVVDGDVEVTPVAVQAAGFDLSAAELQHMTGSFLDPVLEPQTVCVRDRLPAGITLTDIRFANNGSVTLDVRLAGTILSDPQQLDPGSCENSSALSLPE